MTTSAAASVHGRLPGVAGSLVLALVLAPALAGCGGEDGASAPNATATPTSTGASSSSAAVSTPSSTSGPDDAAAAFCAVYLNPPAQTRSRDDATALAAEHSWAEQLRGAGPPPSFEAEARHGFRVFVQALRDLDAEELRGSADLDTRFGDDADDVRTFIGFAATVCAGSG